MLAYITRAGAEIGVASTKAFTTQLVGLFLLTLALARRGRSATRRKPAPQGLRHLPAALQAVLALEPQVIAWARASPARRTPSSSAAACTTRSPWKARLKLKEISYIHAEAYPAGELKHGPLALVTSEPCRW